MGTRTVITMGSHALLVGACVLSGCSAAGGATTSAPPTTMPGESVEPTEPVAAVPDASAPEASQPLDGVDRSSVRIVPSTWSPYGSDGRSSFLHLDMTVASPVEILGVDSVDAWFDGGTAMTFALTAEPPQELRPGMTGFSSLHWNVLLVPYPSTTSFWIWPLQPTERLHTYTIEGAMLPFAVGDLHITVRGQLTSGRAWETTTTTSRAH